MDKTYFWKIPAVFIGGWIAMVLTCGAIGFILGVCGSANLVDTLVHSSFMNILQVGLWVFWGWFIWKKIATKDLVAR